MNPMSQNASAEPVEAPEKGTHYVILRKEERTDATPKPNWIEVGQRTANNRIEAIKSVAEGSAGTYKAVPIRSWDETVEIETEQVTKVTAKVV